MEDQLKQMTNSIAILVGIGVAALYYFVVYDDGVAREANKAQLQVELQASQKKLADMNESMKEAEKFKALAVQLDEDLGRVLAAIPSDYNSLELMKVLSTESKTVGLNILSLNGEAQSASRPVNNNSQDPENKIFYDSVGVTVSLEGTFNQLMKFMSNITKVNRIITISGLKLSIQSTGTELKTAAPKLQFSAKFEAYRYLANGAGGTNE